MHQRYYDPETEMMDRPQLQVLQLKRLRRQVERCYSLSLFYRERCEKYYGSYRPAHVGSGS